MACCTKSLRLSDAEEGDVIGAPERGYSDPTQTVQFAEGLSLKRRWLWLAALLWEGDLWALSFFFAWPAAHIYKLEKHPERLKKKKVLCNSQDLLEGISQDGLEKHEIMIISSGMWILFFFRFQIWFHGICKTGNVSYVCRAKTKITQILRLQNTSLFSVRKF